MTVINVSLVVLCASTTILQADSEGLRNLRHNIQTCMWTQCAARSPYFTSYTIPF